MSPEDVVLSAAVMSHPARLDAALAVRDAAPELDLQVVLDPQPEGVPTSWRTARAAWSAVADGATHHLVVQDDVELAPGTAAWVREAIAAHPGTALCLFAEWGSRTAQAVRVAALRGHDWAPVVDDYLPCVALVLPAEVARAFDEFAVRRTTEETPDDVALLDHLTERGVPAVVPVRGPVEHDVVPSLVGNATMGLRRAVLFSGAADPSAAGGSLLENLEAVPYYDWWDQQAALFVPDAQSPDGWSRLRGRHALARYGRTPEEVLPALEPVLLAHPRGAQLLDRVSRILVDEIYLTGFLLGSVAGSVACVGHRVPGIDDPTARAALSTLPQGALRRVVPENRLAEVGALLGPVVLAGVHHGARRAPEHPETLVA